MLSEMNIEYVLEGDREKIVTNVSSITGASGDDLAFCYYDGKKAVDLIVQSQAGVILCKKALQGMVRPRGDSQIIFLDKPRHVFVKLANKMLQKKRITGVSPSAVVSKTAQVGKGCYIGNFAIIGENCKIGNDTVIHDRVTIGKDCVIGERCVIHPGVVLCNDGFAFERDGMGLYKFPQTWKTACWKRC